VKKAICFDGFKIGQSPWRFSVVIDGCMTTADLLPEDRRVIGKPVPGEEVFVVTIKNKRGRDIKTLIVGRKGKLGPSAMA
jgi:hypothetical protein